jgi:hypothetical protein
MSVSSSVAIGVLVVLWLAVLVPMVAKRREAVPEADDGTRRFRVLRRSSAVSTRKQRRLARVGADDDAVDDTDDGVDELVDEVEELDEEELQEELLDSEDEWADEDDLADPPEPVTARASAQERSERVPALAAMRAPEQAGSDDRYRDRRSVEDFDNGVDDRRDNDFDNGFESGIDEDYTEDDRYDGDLEDDRDDRYTRVDDRHRAEDDGDEDDYSAEDRYQDAPRRDRAEVDDERYRPIPQRRGRGGYDPEAEEQTLRYRYQRRRRISALLVLLTAASVAAAVYVSKTAYAAVALFGLLLVLYLAYLRRQVRVERDIRTRRLAKLRRARQIRPEYGMPVEQRPVSPYRPADRDRTPAAPVSAPEHESARTSTVPPAAYHRSRQIVDLDDDDPRFDDLEYYTPVTYRRAVGE